MDSYDLATLVPLPGNPFVEYSDEKAGVGGSNHPSPGTAIAARLDVPGGSSVLHKYKPPNYHKRVVLRTSISATDALALNGMRQRSGHCT